MKKRFDSRIQNYHPFSFSLTSRLLKPLHCEINLAKLIKTGPLLCPSRSSTGSGRQNYMCAHKYMYDRSIGGLNLPGAKPSVSPVFGYPKLRFGFPYILRMLGQPSAARAGKAAAAAAAASLRERQEAGTTTEKFLHGLKSPAGNIKESTRGKLKIVPMEYSLETFQRSNQDTSLTHKPAVFEGNWVQTGDLLTDCASSVGGELSLGQNILVAYMPWEGYNFEDAILISERLVIDDLYTSVHIERYDIETHETKLGHEQITRDIPDVSEREIQHLDSFGVVKMGAWVEEGDILVGKVTPINKKAISSYQKLLYNILEKEIRPIRDSSLRAPKGIKAKVIDIKYFLRQAGQPSSNNSRQAGKAPDSKSSAPSSSYSETAISATNSKSPVRVEGKPNIKGAAQATALPTKGLGSPKDTASTTLGKRKGNGCPKQSFRKKAGAGEERKGAPESKNFLKKINKTYISEAFQTAKGGPKVERRRASLWLAAPKVGGLGGKSDSKLSSYSYISRFLKMLNLPKEGYQLEKYLSKSQSASIASPHIYEHKKHKKHQYVGSSSKHRPADILRKIETIHIYLAEKRKIQVGDKMAGRHGNKGIVSQILPIQDMPYLPDGTPLDMVLNPLGVPSRMNVGQIYECLLGLAGKFLGENYKVFSFDESYGPEASRSFVFNKLYEAREKTGFKWLFDPNSPGKMCLYDGRTGDCFDQKVTVGQAYMLRLVHMVDDKIHARSTGPYSLVTQQPLRGRSKQGGQRLGEMEVWAIEGYGAAFTLLEMLTIKSDDMTGRMTLWSNLILNKDISIGTPESFKVLICELQALCLDIGLFRYNEVTNQNYIQNKNSLREITSLINLP